MAINYPLDPRTSILAPRPSSLITHCHRERSEAIRVLYTMALVAIRIFQIITPSHYIWQIALARTAECREGHGHPGAAFVVEFILSLSKDSSR